MTNKVTEAIRNNFQSGHVSDVPTKPEPTAADVFGLRPPPMSVEQEEGWRAQANLIHQQTEEAAKQHETIQKQRREAQAAHDKAVWARILARRKAAF